MNAVALSTQTRPMTLQPKGLGCGCGCNSCSDQKLNGTFAWLNDTSSTVKKGGAIIGVGLLAYLAFKIFTYEKPVD